MTAQQAPGRDGSDGNKDTTRHMGLAAPLNEIMLFFFPQEKIELFFSKVHFGPKKGNLSKYFMSYLILVSRCLALGCSKNRP